MIRKILSMRHIKQKAVNYNYSITSRNKFVKLHSGNPGDLYVFRAICLGQRLIKYEPWCESKAISKKLHWEQGWEDLLLVKIAKTTITLGLVLCIFRLVI